MSFLLQKRSAYFLELHFVNYLRYGKLKISTSKIGPQLMHTCELILTFISFRWSLFFKVSIRSLIAMSDKAITAKIKVLLWNWRHCSHGRKLMAPWSDPGGKVKWERWACEESPQSCNIQWRRSYRGS